MTTTIALAGKGGVGKTTIAGLMIRYLTEIQKKPILAIDADPSSNLNIVLGMDIEWTVGDIREDMLKEVSKSLQTSGAAIGSLPGGITKHDYLDMQIRSTVEEGDYVDLIAMGRSEGPGCYCAVNHNLRGVIDTISKNYRYIVIDNEAGMEHLSRRTTRDVQHLVIVTDPSLRGIIAAERIAEIAKDLEINIENFYLILNRIPNELPETIQSRIDQTGIPLIGTIPNNQDLTELEFTGESIFNLNNDSVVYRSINEIMKKILT
jgi:CO dehydrogenase maturation factor